MTLLNLPTLSSVFSFCVGEGSGAGAGPMMHFTAIEDHQKLKTDFRCVCVWMGGVRQLKVGKNKNVAPTNFLRNWRGRNWKQSVAALKSITTRWQQIPQSGPWTQKSLYLSIKCFNYSFNNKTIHNFFCQVKIFSCLSYPISKAENCWFLPQQVTQSDPISLQNLFGWLSSNVTLKDAHGKNIFPLVPAQIETELCIIQANHVADEYAQT